MQKLNKPTNIVACVRGESNFEYGACHFGFFTNTWGGGGGGGGYLLLRLKKKFKKSDNSVSVFVF